MFVTILKSPISNRYCSVGDVGKLDLINNYIKCNGVWFNFDNRWIVQPINL